MVLRPSPSWMLSKHDHLSYILNSRGNLGKPNLKVMTSYLTKHPPASEEITKKVRSEPGGRPGRKVLAL